jgi:hypothetical protein
MGRITITTTREEENKLLMEEKVLAITYKYSMLQGSERGTGQSIDHPSNARMRDDDGERAMMMMMTVNADVMLCAMRAVMRKSCAQKSAASELSAAFDSSNLESRACLLLARTYRARASFVFFWRLCSHTRLVVGTLLRASHDRSDRIIAATRERYRYSDIL